MIPIPSVDRVMIRIEVDLEKVAMSLPLQSLHSAPR